tara:strand:- start:546 stop:929 length:384 start_codon:yes stop_codon:yes gene_type:complete
MTRAVRIIRHAISPRLAIRIELNINSKFAQSRLDSVVFEQSSESVNKMMAKIKGLVRYFTHLNKPLINKIIFSRHPIDEKQQMTFMPIIYIFHNIDWIGKNLLIHDYRFHIQKIDNNAYCAHFVRNI